MQAKQSNEVPTKLIFFARVINKLSGLFSELQDMYLKVLLPPNPASIGQNSEEIKSTNDEVDSFQSKPVEGKEDQVREGNEQSILGLRNPPSSFMLFFKDNKQEIGKSFPNYNSKQVISLARQIWRDLSQDEKQYYNKLHCEEKKKYYQAIKSYRDGLNSISKQEKLLKKKEKKNKMPLKSDEGSPVTDSFKKEEVVQTNNKNA